MNVYLIGSLRNPEVPKIANKLREAGFETFDDWYAAGPEADDAWRDYEKGKGNTLPEALKGYAAKHVFEFDKRHLERVEAVVLVLPAGKSGHLELGWALGKGKRGYILLDNDPDRYDVMYQFADMVTKNLDEIVTDLKKDRTILYECCACSQPIRIGQAYTGLGVKGEYAHYECYTEAIVGRVLPAGSGFDI